MNSIFQQLVNVIRENSRNSRKTVLSPPAKTPAQPPLRTASRVRQPLPAILLAFGEKCFTRISRIYTNFFRPQFAGIGGISVKPFVPLALFLIMGTGTLSASNIRFGPFTNAISGGPATNDIIVFAVGTTANADGSYSVQGLPKRLHISPDGSTTNFLMAGNYIYTNAALAMAIGFGGFPQDAGPTIYNASDWLIPGRFGGLNFFVTHIFSNGVGTITFNAVTNALGYQPVSPTDAIALTNQLTRTNDTTWFDAKGAALAATNGLPARVWTLGTASKSNATDFVTTGQGASLTNQLTRTNDTTWFDAKGASLAATSGLPARVWTLGTISKSNATDFVTAGQGAALTNQLTRTNDTTWFDAKGASLAATSGLPARVWTLGTISKSNATDFVTTGQGASLTNQLTRTNDTTWFDAKGAALNATSGLPATAFKPFGYYQPASPILTNLSATGANTNQYIAGSNVTLTTNAGVVTIASTGGGGGTNNPSRAGTNTTVVNVGGTNVISADVSHAEVSAVATAARSELNSASNVLAALIISGTNASYIYAAAKAQQATNDFGRTVAVNLTNTANAFTGLITATGGSNTVTNNQTNVVFGSVSIVGSAYGDTANFNTFNGNGTALTGDLLHTNASQFPIVTFKRQIVVGTNAGTPTVQIITNQVNVGLGSFMVQLWYNSGFPIVKAFTDTTYSQQSPTNFIMGLFSGGSTYSEWNKTRLFFADSAGNVQNIYGTTSASLTNAVKRGTMGTDTNTIASLTDAAAIATIAATAAAAAATNNGNIVFTNNTTWFDAKGAALNATSGLPARGWTLGTASQSNATDFVTTGQGATITAFATNSTTAISNWLAFVQGTVGKDTNTLITAGFGNGSMNGTNRWSGSALTNLNGVAYVSNGLFTVSGIVLYFPPSGYLVGNTIIATNSGGTVGTTRFATASVAAGGDLTAVTVDGVTTVSGTNNLVTAANIAAVGGVTNLGPAVLSSLSASNASYGEYAINKASSSANAGQVDTFSGNRNFIPHNGPLIYYDNQGGGASYTHPSVYDGSQVSALFGWKLPEPRSGGTPPIWTFDVWGDSSVWAAYRAWQTMPANMIVPELGGSGSGLNDLGIDPRAIASAEPLPPVVFTTYFGAATPKQGQTETTNYVYSIFTNSIYPWITNNYSQRWLHMDATTIFWQTNRDANGYLSINPQFFPDGTNIINRIRAMGFKTRGTLYTYPYPTNLFTTDYIGAAARGTNCMPSTSENFAYQDTMVAYDIRLDGLRLADGQITGPGNTIQLSRKFAEAVLYPLVPGNGQMISYANAAGRNLSVPLSTEYLYSRSASTPAGMLNNLNEIGSDAVASMDWYGGFDVGSDFADEVNYFRMQYTFFAHRTGPGQYCYIKPFIQDFGTNMTRLRLSMIAIGSHPLQIYAWTNNSLPQNYPVLTSQWTNSQVFIRISQDKAVNRPWKLWDNGPTNNSVWYKKLDDGSIGLSLLNDATTATNLTISLTSFPPGTYSATEAWNGALGNVATSFTYSLSATNGALILLTPVPPLSPKQFVYLATNVVSTNLGAGNFPLYLRITNNGIFHITCRIKAQGLAATDYPDSQLVATNTATAGYGMTGDAFLQNSTMTTMYGQNELAASTAFFPITATGDGFNRLVQCDNSANGGNASKTVLMKPSLECNITNAPVNIYPNVYCGNDKTHTNTVFQGTWMMADQIQ